MKSSKTISLDIFDMEFINNTPRIKDAFSHWVSEQLHNSPEWDEWQKTHVFQMKKESNQ
jgi:hypothetical protein